MRALGICFQDSYCRVLVRYKEELSRPFDEAASFLSSIQAQLSNLCSGGSSPAATTATHSGEETHASIYGLAKKTRAARIHTYAWWHKLQSQTHVLVALFGSFLE